MIQPWSYRFFDIALWLAGAGHFVILFASFQVPFQLDWRRDLAQLKPFNRKLLWVQGGFTVLTIIAFGLLTLVLHREFIEGGRTATGLAIFIGTYWTTRVLVDALYFSHAQTKLLPAEALLDAISTVTGTTTQFDGLPRGARATQIPDGKMENPFLKTFGRPARELACECERESDSNLSQALQLIGGATVNGKLHDDNGRMRDDKP